MYLLKLIYHNPLQRIIAVSSSTGGWTVTEWLCERSITSYEVVNVISPGYPPPVHHCTSLYTLYTPPFIFYEIGTKCLFALNKCHAS